MLTRLKLKRGDGKLVESPAIGSRGRRARLPNYSKSTHPQVEFESSVNMYHEGEPIMIEEERSFKKEFFDMVEMVKVLYEERNLRMQGESSRPPRGEGSSGGRGHGDGTKPTSTPPSSSPPSTPSSS